ncbi:sel1 repeat family protein [Pseudoteredinibacter isoporae]|uniref:TPR repeat protein n=1 Tax=Pseudoteredinibacter isoporae TaxID=570281 RepID=A0A7X0JUB4_9GAMM|nr:sel1 repeat family protein [Pseudoteredinibacter isoporae]MBB6522425.1 TPR repeat protein [Pseudoteredinibacter isoporae]
MYRLSTRTVATLSLALVLASHNSFSSNSCTPEEIGLTAESSNAEMLFYTGTCHYRNEDFIAAGENWKKLISLNSVDESLEELKVTAHNNLGYLMFFGLGFKMDKEQAIEHWVYALSKGNEESEFHLCHARADSRQPTYDHLKAIVHCESAKLIYGRKPNPDESEQQVLSVIDEYLDLLAQQIP